MEETAKFQTFPPGYKFDAKIAEARKQIGNAVPPAFIVALTKGLVDNLEQTDGIIHPTRA
jgi:site-specific DNA-cytosine methylase